jgi:cytochrome c553
MIQYRCDTYNPWIACEFKACVSHMKKTLISLSTLLGLLALAPAARSQDVKADPAAGEKKAAMCIGCHGIPGYQASFPEVHKVPMIAGQDASYIVSSLQGYAKGDRKHPTMRAIAGSLSSQDMADLAAFYQQQAKGVPAVPAKLESAPPAAVVQLLDKQVPKCVTCHGENFSAPIALAPKLAGQHADYLYVALKSYAVQNNPQLGRNHPSMTSVAPKYTNAELRQLANYLSTLPSELRVVPQPRLR